MQARGCSKGLQKSHFQLCCIRDRVVIKKKKVLKSTRQKNWYHHDAKKPIMKKKFCSVNLLFLNKFHYYSKKLKLSKSPISFLWLVFLLLFFYLFVWRLPRFLLTARTNIPNHQNTLKFSKWGDTRNDPPLSRQAKSGWRYICFHLKQLSQKDKEIRKFMKFQYNRTVSRKLTK